MKNYLENNKYGCEEELNIRDAVNTAFMRITNGPKGIRQRTVLKTSFGTILIHITYEKNVSPYKRVYAYSKSQAPINDFTADHFQDGFDSYLQFKFHTSARNNIMKYKSLIYSFLVYGFSIICFYYIKDQIHKTANESRRLPVKFDGMTLALNLAMSYNDSYTDTDTFRYINKNELVDQLLSSSMDPLRIALSTQKSLTKETISEVLQDKFTTAEHYKYTRPEIHCIDHQVADKMNTFYYKMILFIVETSVPEKYQKNLLNMDNYKKYNEKTSLSDVDFIIKWICGSLKDAVKD